MRLLTLSASSCKKSYLDQACLTWIRAPTGFLSLSMLFLSCTIRFCFIPEPPLGFLRLRLRYLLMESSEDNSCHALDVSDVTPPRLLHDSCAVGALKGFSSEPSFFGGVNPQTMSRLGFAPAGLWWKIAPHWPKPLQKYHPPKRRVDTPHHEDETDDNGAEPCPLLMWSRHREMITIPPRAFRRDRSLSSKPSSN